MSSAPPRGEITEKVRSGVAWKEFCRVLETAGDAILAEGNPDDVLDRAEGFRSLTRLLRYALETYIESNDPLRPKLVALIGETIKIAAENPDNIYHGATIDGCYDYRVWGTRGEACRLTFNTFRAGGFGGSGQGVGTTLHDEELKVAPDGTFELILSQHEHPGAWLRLHHDTRGLSIRETFTDKKNERPAELHIERIGAEGPAPAPLDPAQFYHGLMRSAHYVRAVTEMMGKWSCRQAAQPNVFVDAETNDTRLWKDTQIKYHQAYFELGAEEALVIEFTPPRCKYWMIVLHNHWTETLDYRYHQITLNCRSAQVRADGSVRCVVAHRDPGVPNWLDTAGHARGTVGVRWVGPDVADVVPTARLVCLPDAGR
ncbi:MAG: hypothetical protein H6Q33_3609 [Deltaproteobacteria bacterium]|nr:hypothetical protein [Deltaproteobacteria bacterium]